MLKSDQGEVHHDSEEGHCSEEDRKVVIDRIKGERIPEQSRRGKLHWEVACVVQQVEDALRVKDWRTC